MPKFKDLNLSVNLKTTELSFAGQKIEVKSYLAAEEKASIISLAVRGALYEGAVNDVLMDAYFHMFIVENYTDINFDDGSVDDILMNYDKIISTGLLDQILNAIPEEEYNYLADSLATLKQQVVAYTHSYAGSVSANQESLKLVGDIIEKTAPVRPGVPQKEAPKPRSRTRRTRN